MLAVALQQCLSTAEYIGSFCGKHSWHQYISARLHLTAAPAAGVVCFTVPCVRRFPLRLDTIHRIKPVYVVAGIGGSELKPRLLFRPRKKESRLFFGGGEQTLPSPVLRVAHCARATHSTCTAGR